MNYFFVILIGLCIGSFLNVCIYRIPEEQSIAFPPSHCMSCGYELKILDLFPVVSYIFLKGRCRSCGEKISIQYPIIELINGLIVITTRGMGEGDIEIAGISGLLLGSKATIFMLFSSFVIGGLVGIIYIVLKKKGRKDEMAFGPCLAIGTILSMFIGNQVILAYINMYL